jgi:hypothetical protein
MEKEPLIRNGGLPPYPDQTDLVLHPGLLHLYSRLCMFQSGWIIPQRVFDNSGLCGARTLKGFFDLPAIALVRPKSHIDGQPEQVTMQQYIQSKNDIDYMNKDKVASYKFDQKISADNFEMIDVGQVSYEKPLVFIYNPNSGKKVDRRDQIAKKMAEHGLKYEMFVTQRQFEAI